MSKKWLFRFAAALAAPALAVAQPPAPVEASLDIDSSGLLTPVNGIYRIGQCVVRRDRGAALRLLEMMPIDGEPQLQEAARTIADAGCLSGPLPADFPVFLRGAIAQEMLRSDYPEMSAQPHSVARLVDLALPVQSDGEAAEEVSRRYQWSDCVVRNDMENVERLVRTGPGSSQETDVLTRMASYMSACMDDGPRFAASSAEIRTLFMQSAYHSLYRYWNGEIQGAGLVDAENPNGQLVCRTNTRTASRVMTERHCMSERDWYRQRTSTRDSWDEWIRQSTTRPYQ